MPNAKAETKGRGRVTITLKADLHRRLRIAAAKAGVRIQAMLDEIVSRALKGGGR